MSDDMMNDRLREIEFEAHVGECARQARRMYRGLRRAGFGWYAALALTCAWAAGGFQTNDRGEAEA